MGSPLAPVLANLFMGHHEKLWLENFQGSKILFIVDMLTTLSVYFTRNMMSLYFLIISTLDTPTSGSLWKKKLITNYPFLDVLVNSNDPNSLLTSVYRKKTFTGLLTNYFSFTSYSYKVGLIRTLVDRAYKINNTWSGATRGHH